MECEILEMQAIDLLRDIQGELLGPGLPLSLDSYLPEHLVARIVALVQQADQ